METIGANAYLPKLTKPICLSLNYLIEAHYMLCPDILADIKLYKTEDDGRKTSTAANFFGCSFIISMIVDYY